MPMDRDNRGPRGRKRRKVCAFCVDKVECIDYKDAAKLRRYISERAKILPRRTTGTCDLSCLQGHSLGFTAKSPPSASQRSYLAVKPCIRSHDTF